MKVVDALKIFNIDSLQGVDLHRLKHAYHIACLKYHPDKNSSSTANAEFRIINDAYETILSASTVYSTGTSGATNVMYGTTEPDIFNIFSENFNFYINSFDIDIKNNLSELQSSLHSGKLDISKIKETVTMIKQFNKN